MKRRHHYCFCYCLFLTLYTHIVIIVTLGPNPEPGLFPHLILSRTLVREYRYPHFTREELFFGGNQAQKDHLLWTLHHWNTFTKSKM